MTTMETREKVDAKSVRLAVADWIVRLNHLYDQLDDWLKDISGARAVRGKIRQGVEPLMKRFKISPQEIPTYAVVVADKNRLEFIPNVIWIIGANGRIDVMADADHHTLVDVGGNDGQPSEWKMVVEDANKLVIPFNKRAFLSLLRERD